MSATCPLLMNVIIWLIMSTSISQAPINIVYLHSHDTGRYIQPYGYALQTPHMQKFAEHGVLFRQAFCVGPTCSPSRAGLLTGQSAHSSGMLGLAHRGWGLTDYKQHLLHTLKAQGYHTALAGLQHIAHGPECATKVIGYDQAIPWNNSYAQVTDNAITILRERKDKNQPFFLSAGYLLTHRTNKKGESVQWHCHEDSPLGDSRYVMPPAPLPDTPITRKDFADFAVSAKRLDDQYGQILQTLEDTGLGQEHTGHYHHRSRDRFPAHEVQPDRPWDGGLVDDARSTGQRLYRWQSGGQHGQPH
ncbi:MAG: sulfatase-like hydrolase/transferase [Phycisphaerales bacterium]|nr:sulfatase-like hydrolase/transferase [Phycisphaerales bacterium]